MADSRCLLAAVAISAGVLLPLYDASAACESAALGPAAERIAKPLAQLQDAIRRNTELNTDLDQPTVDAIRVLKQRLARLVSLHMACVDAGKPAAAQLDTALAVASRAFTQKPAPQPGGSSDYAVDGVRFASTAFHDGKLLGVVSDIDIPCGSDAQWQLFAKHAEGWSEVLHWSAPPYFSVDGAWWSFQGVVSPPDTDGRWLAAATHVRPWCSSSWSVIDYAVLRPAAQAESPQVLLRGDDSIWWGSEDMGRLSLDNRHFELRFTAASIDSGVHSREFIRRFGLSTTPPRRVPPVAVSARDFIDEWLVSTWSDAQHWTAPSAAMDMQRIHAQWQQWRKDGSLEFAPTRRCGADSVEVTVQRDEGRAGYFSVGGGANFRLYKVSDTRNDKCREEVPTP